VQKLQQVIQLKLNTISNVKTIAKQSSQRAQENECGEWSVEIAMIATFSKTMAIEMISTRVW
jgi:hypothetical protein